MATQKAEYIWGLGKSLPNLSLVGEMERGEGALQQMPLLALGKNCFSHYHSLSQSLEDSEVGLEKKKRNETTTQWCNSNFRKDAFQLMCMLLRQIAWNAVGGFECKRKLYILSQTLEMSVFSLTWKKRVGGKEWEFSHICLLNLAGFSCFLSFLPFQEPHWT